MGVNFDGSHHFVETESENWNFLDYVYSRIEKHSIIPTLHCALVLILVKNAKFCMCNYSMCPKTFPILFNTIPFELYRNGTVLADMILRK